jgi:polysaccharide export outer membrane protein
MIRFFVRLAVLTTLFVTIGARPTSAQSADRPAVLLRAGDAVRLEVRDEPELAGELRVDESGRVLLPLVGLVAVAGRDFEEVRREVLAAYAKELAHREVRITPLLRIAVLGEVRSPGLYPVDPTYTLGDVLALAGGFTFEANRSHIRVVRAGEVISDVRDQDTAALARPLSSGDQVVVARRNWLSANSGTLVGAGASLIVTILATLILR